MENEQIKAIKNWPESISIIDFQVFIGFANFYWRFILGFSRIALSFIFLLKTTRLFEKLAPKIFKVDDNKIVNDNGSKINKTSVNLSKNLTHVPNIDVKKQLIFLIPNAKKTFNSLK